MIGEPGQRQVRNREDDRLAGANDRRQAAGLPDVGSPDPRAAGVVVVRTAALLEVRPVSVAGNLSVSVLVGFEAGQPRSARQRSGEEKDGG